MSDLEAQLAEALRFKQEGNTRCQAGEYQKALGSYHKVFCYINGWQMPGEQSEAASYAQMMNKTGNTVPQKHVEAVQNLRSSTNLNMAMCYLKVGKFPKCIDACTKVLDMNKNSKAFFRRGQAHLEMRNLDEAKADFEEARALEPTNAAITAELRRVKAAFAQHEAKEKKKFSKMFDKMAKESPAETPAAPSGEGLTEVVPMDEDASAADETGK
eukprot:TRINITY_DN76797_c0_g1_i1.p1 TRINITY_DN76797_c0_g1~~TRINITY_DN76797_c0_g1_i1.p1  ORF type:complete len:214 (+),score=54.86 TRINITY_DN76797_c0_g1_i1:97-738(+)